MGIGVLYNAFVCLVIGITSLVVFFALRRKRKKKEVIYHEGIDYFSLFLGLVWLSVSARFFLLWFGYHQLSLFVFKWLIGPLSFFHLVPGFYYLGWSFFKNNRKIRLLFDGTFTLVALVALSFFFLYGFQESEPSYWGSKVKYDKLATNIFNFGFFVPGFLSIIIDMSRRFRGWKKTGSFKEKQLFGFSLAFFMYSVTGAFERMIFTEGWKMLLARIGIMTAPLILYFCATLEREE